jgi:glycosyltransferase involved in cell wall biosynthesis
MEEPVITLIHHSTAFDSMERYALDLYKATSKFTRLFSLVYGPNDSAPREATILEGIFSKSKKFHYINYIDPGTTVKGYKNVIKDTHDSGGIVHYTAGYIFPYNLIHRDVVTIHDVYSFIYPSKVPFIERIYSDRSLKSYKTAELNNVITDSEFSKSVLEENGFDSNIKVVHLPISENFIRIVDKQQARKMLGLPLDKKIILSISNLQWRKNLRGILKTMDLLGSDYVLARVGPDVGGSICFEKIDDNKLNLLYNAVDALFYPSFYEGFGYVPLEAAKVGIPVVLSDISVFHEVLGEYPVYVDPNDIISMSRGVKEAVDMEDDRRIIDLSKFSFSKFEENMIGFYSGII